MNSERSSKRVAALAGKVLNGTITTHNVTAFQLRTLAASCLTQAPDKAAPKKKARRKKS